MSKALVILSGGMDSSVLLHYVSKVIGKETYAITFDYGQRISREIDCAREQAKNVDVIEHRVVKMDFFKDISSMSALTNTNLSIPKAREDIGNAQPLSYVPFRNLLLITTAAAWAETLGVTDIYYGAVETDNHSGYWDCTSDFLNYVNCVFNLNRKHTITIHAPFIDMQKHAIVKEGIELKVNFKSTHTCYEGTEIGCGECVSCSARIKAFMDNNIIDPIDYSRNIPWSEYNCVKLQ